MNEGLMIDDNEDYAFYESGLSADGCLEKLDDYTRKAIKRYGEILLEKQKEDFVKGFKGCCYCCEPVGMTNVELEKENERLRDCLMEICKDDGRAILSKIEKALNMPHNPGILQDFIDKAKKNSILIEAMDEKTDWVKINY